MANRINVKLILELRSGGMSQNEIARTRHMSKTSVSTVVNIAKERSISFEDIRDLNDDVIYRMFFPEKMLTEDMYELPDYEYVHKELRRVYEQMLPNAASINIDSERNENTVELINGSEVICSREGEATMLLINDSRYIYQISGTASEKLLREIAESIMK